jgi:hypothetical protein
MDCCKLLEDKRRALWLDVGDHNTKYFQKIANHMKNCNTIWELEDQHGSKKRSFLELAELGVSHFQDLFAEKEPESIADM